MSSQPSNNSPKGPHLHQSTLDTPSTDFFPESFKSSSFKFLPEFPTELIRAEDFSTYIDQGPDAELIRVKSNQLSILISTIDHSNFDSNFKQIKYILLTSTVAKKGYQSRLVFHSYIQKLVFACLTNQYQDSNSKLHPVELLLKDALEFVAKNLEYSTSLIHCLIQAYSSEEKFNLINFLNKFDCDLVLSFIIAIDFEVVDPEVTQQFIQTNSIKLSNFVKSYKEPFNWNIVLEKILKSKSFPFLHKLSTIASLDAFNLDISPVNKFYKLIIDMSFKQLLLEIGPDSLLSDKLLPSLLQLKSNEGDSSVALILSEVLIPGSQGVTNPNGPNISFAVVNSLPEAREKGLQLQSCFTTIDNDDKFNLNWYDVFAQIQVNLFDSSKRNIQPSIANITQFLSALDFKKGIIDIFLNYDWWFKKTLLYTLHSMNPQQGGYDITSLDNLTLCFDDEENNDPLNGNEIQPPGFAPINTNKNILRFINIGKLELLVLTKISQENQDQNISDQEKKLNAYLSQIFEHDYRVYPEYLITSALSIVDKNNFIIDLIDALFNVLMDLISPSLDKVLVKFKEFDIQLALSKLIDYYNRRGDTESSNKILSVASKSGLLDDLLNKFWSLNFKLGLSFTVDASNYGYDYKQVVESKFKDPNTKGELCQSLMEILELRATHDYEWGQQQILEASNAVAPKIVKGAYKVLRVPVVYYLLEKLKNSNGLIDAERLKNLQLLLLTTYPRLINFGCGHDEPILSNETLYSSLFPPQVEGEMKTYYSKMYNKEMEIKEIVDMLVRMKTSSIPHDQDVFCCMIHSLLDEYRFFSEYPLTALASTSLLFGALLQKDLIQGTTLTVALNFIWESCNQPQDSHLFKFAVQSLYNFKSRLHEYPIYCKHLLECQSLSAHAKMYQIVKDASNGIACPDSNAANSGHSQSHDGSRAPSSQIDDSKPNYQSITVTDKTIGFIQQEKPSESISDKLLFFVNNMTADNLASKLPEIKEILTENYFLWFSTYLVSDRAKAEPNNHGLYAELVKLLENPIFVEYVLNVSLNEVEHLIRNFKDSSTERSHLKNLGAWLGKITLADDKPLRRDQIALKFLLVEAFDFKSLHLIIPFVCKILDQAQYSKIFKPPNPWVLGIIKVLAELYECADLKLNLKFEIEVLLNSFKLKIKDIEPSTLVRSHNPKPSALAAMFGIHPENTITNEMSRLVLDGNEVPGDQAGLHMQQQQKLQARQQAQLLQAQGIQPQIPPVGGIDDPSIAAGAPPAPDAIAGSTGQQNSAFSTLVGNTIFTQNPNLRRAFQASLSRAVRECAIPILSRVSEAVLTTTEALIRKDFATEVDLTKFRSSYQTLAQQLSHSMVVCSGRKILSETIEATMISLLGNINPAELPLAELNLAIQSNVDLCVDIVDKIAAGNIGDMIDERMQKYVLAREHHPAGKPFVEEFASDYALRLPPPLGLQPEGLSSSQINIYAGFGTNGSIVKADSEAQITPGIVPDQSGTTPVPSAAIPVTLMTPQQQLSSMNQPPQTQLQQPPRVDDLVSIDQLFAAITQNCEKAIELLTNVKETKLSDLGADHPIMNSLTQALSLAQSRALKSPELLLKVAQYAVNCLFTQLNDNPMSNEIYVVVLDKLCEYSPSTAKDVIWWLVHSSDQRKFNMPVMFSLLKVQLVQPIKLDASVGKLISDSNSPIVVKFAASLLLNVFSSDELRPIALRSEFAFTLDALSKYVGDESTEEGKQAKNARDDLFEFLKKSSLPAAGVEKTPELYTQMGYIFTEWIKLLTHGESTEILQKYFIQDLFNKKILVEPDYFEAFFKAATEVSTTAFATEHEVRSRTQREVFLAVDAFAILIVQIILNFDKDHPEEAIDYLRNIFGILILVLTNDHEAESNWNERAYFRIFSSLLCWWNEASVTDKDATSHLDSYFFPFIGEVFNSLQPIIYPGFTFAWISLISHRMFLPRLLELPEKKGYPTAVKLMTAILKFDSVYAKDEFVHHDVINVIFKAINRMFVGLSHDNPEFLAECHYQLVTAVPNNYVQLKNIILSATPKNIQLVDPFTQGLKVERLPEINDAPTVAYKPSDDLVKVGLKKPVDNFLRIPAPTLMRSIYNGTKLNHPKYSSDYGFTTVHYNVKLINALVLHIGISAVADRLPNNVRGFNTKSSHVALLVDLVNNGTLEFKFHIINSIANQLRYPNSHTHWFIGIILFFFSSNSIWGQGNAKLTIQEIITRVLLERQIVNKPHPWGLTIVFTELVKNGDYGFFELPFVKDASPELKVIFEALSRNVKGGPAPSNPSNPTLAQVVSEGTTA